MYAQSSMPCGGNQLIPAPAARFMVGPFPPWQERDRTGKQWSLEESLDEF